MTAAIDWASWATAIGTLVLAMATFASIRSANRSARNAERALQIGLRPVLFASRPHETIQKIHWGDGHWVALAPGRAILEEEDGVIFLAMSLQNVGSGIAVLHGWRIDAGVRINPNASVEEMRGAPMQTQPAADSFRSQSRDLYSPPGDISFWQAAIRTQDDPDRPLVEQAIHEASPLVIDLLYGDHEGGQRTISRFSVAPHPGADNEWFPSVVRHWYVDQHRVGD